MEEEEEVAALPSATVGAIGDPLLDGVVVDVGEQPAGGQRGWWWGSDDTQVEVDENNRKSRGNFWKRFVIRHAASSTQAINQAES